MKENYEWLILSASQQLSYIIQSRIRKEMRSSLRSAKAVFCCKAKGQKSHKSPSLQIGCNAVSWAPAVVPGSLIDQPSGQKPNYIKKFASGGCDNLIKLWK